MSCQGMSASVTREGVPRVAIILTDGMSQTPLATADQARLVHQQGITVFVIGTVFVISTVFV